MTDIKEIKLIRRKPVIVCAANRNKDGHIICGARHWDKIMVSQFKQDHIAGFLWEQGFIDQFGKFYNRKDAMKVVKESCQPFNADRNGGNGEDLYSEGLY